MKTNGYSTLNSADAEHGGGRKPDLPGVHGCVATALAMAPEMDETARVLLESALRLLGPDAVPKTRDLTGWVYVALDPGGDAPAD